MLMSRQKKKKSVVKKMNLSEHTLDINIRRCNYNKFNFSEIEDYVDQLTGTREYQKQAIKQVMIYLWGGAYKTIVDLAKDNYVKPRIQQRFSSQKMLVNHLPLPDRLSGVVHMATGTGKSYVIFAVAYLFLVMGLTRRVLVLGPASTIIEQGLREKFKDLMTDKSLMEELPMKYRGKAINILNDNDPIEDDSIVIENINAVYTFGSITDTLFKNTDEVLVLGDEIHHAYSHLQFSQNQLVMDKDETVEGKRTAEKEERLWMQFLRRNKKITRHIGFTGTPYNKDEYFADIIYNYSIKDAINQKYIKDINNNVRTRTDEGDKPLTIDQRFEIVLKNHLDNRKKYAYRLRGKRQVKPVTIFICPTQKNAQDRSEAFIKFLADYEKKHKGATGTDSEITGQMRQKVICVVSRISESEYKEQLEHIEEINPQKTGGSVEYIFAVNKLSEGWDVDNVFQIVPMEERVFKSKLLISQVLGRGLRIPRNIPSAHIHQTYPCLTVTNHDRFADHIKELVDAVTQSDMYISSRPLINPELFRAGHLDFGEVIVADRYPTEEDIKAVIQKAMETVDITGNRLSLENKKQIENYFNQFLPPGTKKRIFENIEGNLIPTATCDMDKHSLRLSELDKDATAFLSEDYETELSDDNKTVLEFLSEWRGTQQQGKQLMLPMFDADPFITAHPDIIRSLVENDERSPYVVNASRLKNPQYIVLVSHTPEREFVFQLIDHADYIDAWIKSPDKGFYSIDYEFWRGGKDRTRRGFNPDFFIKIHLDNYLLKLITKGQNNHIETLRNFQDEGIEYLIRVVEIKSDDDQDESTPAKAEYAKAHFKKVNQRLKTVNIADISKKYRPDARQHYMFDLLTPVLYDQWFSGLRKGIVIEA